jgi:predicted molibdopterin-dependent oxidoreductase YjgC
MSKFTIYIDSQPVTASAGDSVLKAALDAGIYIPHLCYDKRLQPYGGCRMCIVEIEGMRGLPAACTTAVCEGMKVTTSTPELDQVRLDTLELLLADHPVDCLSCPSNQRCELQNMAAFLGFRERSLKPRKTEYPVDDSNPFFKLDRNYCILCARCVRTCDEVTGVNAIEIIHRGDLGRVGTFNEMPLADSICKSCGECVVACPVGALSLRSDTVETEETVSVCPYCGVGCGLILGKRQGKIVSVRGDEANPASLGRLCVKGRFGIGEFVHHQDRLSGAYIRREGRLMPATLEEAVRFTSEKFSTYRPDEIAVIASAKATNEDNYVLQKFTRAVLSTNNIDHCARL